MAVTFDMDAESVMLAAGADLDHRVSLASHQRYGPSAGVPRIIDLLAERGIRATFFVPGHTAERFPEAVDAVLDAGHEVGHHGYAHELLVGASESDERRYLERGLEALEVRGVRPTGYRAPWWETTERTHGLLVEYGFGYDSSLFDADRPYPIDVGAGSIVEIPVSWALDDWERYAFWPGITGSGVIASASSVVEAWWEEVVAYHEEGGCCVLTMHPFLTGRPARARALGLLLDRVAELEGVWIAPLTEIAGRLTM